MICLSIMANAQDVILKQDGSEIRTKILEITDEHIKYKEFDFQNGPIRNIKISEVVMITYENGEKKDFHSQHRNDSGNKALILDLLKNDGYTIRTNQSVYLKQREFGSHIQNFYSGVEYAIICFSDDTNVLSIEIHIERINGKIDAFEAFDHGEIAMIFLKPKNNRKLKVVATNLSSCTPNSASECRIIVASKK